MKQAIMVLSVIIAGYLWTDVAYATGGGHRQDDCNGVLNCNDVEITDESVNNHNRNEAEADANARSNADADSRSNSSGVGIGVGEGGDAAAIAGGGDAAAGVVGSGNSRNDVEGGDAYAHQGQSSSNRNNNDAEGGDAYSGSSSDSRSRVLDSGNSESVSGSDVSVDASDNSSYSSSYNYEEAAKSAGILYGQVCSDVTNIQGVKFGIGSSKQSAFCQQLTVAQGFFAAASMLGCADPVNVAKGAVPIRSPGPSECERDQRQLYKYGIDALQTAESLIPKKDGFVKKLWNFIW